MVGTIAFIDINPDTEEPIIDGTSIDFLVQFDKYRSLKDKLLGKNKFTSDAPVITQTEAILKNKVLDMHDYSRED